MAKEYEIETIEGNKLIAEFMGLEGQHEYWCGNNVLIYDQFLDDTQMEPYNPHENWAWLMPVVEKIESLGYTFKMCRRRVEVDVDGEHGPYPWLLFKEETKLISAWSAAVEFIKRHNSLVAAQVSDTTDAQ